MTSDANDDDDRSHAEGFAEHRRCRPNEHRDADPDEDDEHTDDSDTDSDGDYDDDDDDDPPRSASVAAERRQHLLAALVAAAAAVLAHAGLHGGYDAWREALARDWSSRGASTAVGGGPPSASAAYPSAAPSMDMIPVSQRRRALARMLGENDADRGAANSGGHARARHFRRTRGLSFCPPSGDPAAAARSDGLAEMEFVLPLEPSARVLHAHYLADALGVEDAATTRAGADAVFGCLHGAVGDGEGPTLAQVRACLPAALDADPQHLCLLRQYASCAKSGRSLRGTAWVYERPELSTFYRDGKDRRPDDEGPVLPASLSFTGYAAKFVNLSGRAVRLYWDGGRGAGSARLVGTVPSMDSLGTASFPGHSFYVAPTYDRDHQLRRWSITADEPVLYYDPLAELSAAERRAQEGKWTEEQRFARDAWLVDRSFGRDYLVRTGNAWLANFPQPYLNTDGGEHGSCSGDDEAAEDATSAGAPEGHRLHMWPAEHIGQTHTLATSHLHYAGRPPTFEAPEAKGRHATKRENSTAALSLTLEVKSVAPRVLEVPEFLSPAEVQHLIGLASDPSRAAAKSTEPSEITVKDNSGDRGAGDAAADVWIHREQDAIVDAVFGRLADLLGVDEARTRGDRADANDRPVVEALRLRRIGAGEGDAARHDLAHPPMRHRSQPRRYAAVLLHLTGTGDVVENGRRRKRSAAAREGDRQGEGGLRGGNATFPRAITAEFHDGVSIEPQSGKAILFYNVLPDGNVDELSIHATDTVERGVLYLANLWFWDPIVN